MCITLASFQDYAARLARVRLYSQAKDVRLRSLETTLETRSESVAITPGTGKLRLLKMELDEAVKKEEEERQQSHDLADLVMELQQEIAERDRVISQMREEGFSVASFTAGDSPPGSPFVMSSPGNRSPTSPSSRSPPLGRSYDSTFSESGGFKSFNQVRLSYVYKL